jgi:hypothetical protein
MTDPTKHGQKLVDAAATMADVANDPREVAARDWAGFFSALGQFVTVLAPLILSFITANPAAKK